MVQGSAYNLCWETQAKQPQRGNCPFGSWHVFSHLYKTRAVNNTKSLLGKMSGVSAAKYTLVINRGYPPVASGSATLGVYFIFGFQKLESNFFSTLVPMTQRQSIWKRREVAGLASWDNYSGRERLLSQIRCLVRLPRTIYAAAYLCVLASRQIHSAVDCNPRWCWWPLATNVILLNHH